MGIKPREKCLICGGVLGWDTIEASVDDGRPPGTPYRWRKVGHVCSDRCDRKFNEQHPPTSTDNTQSPTGENQ